MGKNLLVPEELICNVMKLLFYLERDLNHRDFAEVRHLCSRIENEIFKKLEKMERRKVFTAYKTAAPGQERESLRRDYIELAHIQKSFTSNDEIPYYLIQ